MTNAPPLDGLSSYQEAARAHGFDRSWWSEFYAGVRKQST
jgi:hypothetical protein